MFDISVDLHQNAKFNTHKNLAAAAPHKHVYVQSVNACTHYYTRSNIQEL